MDTFVFVCAEHPEFGGLGWRLKSQPDFDPLSGMGVAHDCLEHFTDSANPADEFMALGASVFVRSGYYARKGKYHTDPATHISSDFPEILSHIENEGYDMPKAPRIRVTDSDSYAVSVALDTIQAARRNLREEDNPDLKITADVAHSIRNYMVLGYRKATKRFHGREQAAEDLFCEIEDRADKALKYAEEGYQLTVKIDFKKVKLVGIESGYPEEDYYD